MNQAGAAAGIIKRKAVDVLRTGENKFGCGDRLELGGNVALRFDDELFVLNVKTDRRVRLMWVCILAGQRFELVGREENSLRFLWGCLSNSRHNRKRGNKKNQKSDTKANQANNPIYLIITNPIT